MPRRRQKQRFEPASLEDILAGRVDSDTFSDRDDVLSAEIAQPHLLQVREAGRGFNPEFIGEDELGARFRLLDGLSDDAPFRMFFLEFMQSLDAVRARIKEREQDGLPPSPSDVLREKKLQRGLNELFPNLFRHGQ